MIQDLFGLWCIEGIGESTLVMDSSVPVMHHDPDRSWITDPDPDHPKGTQPKITKIMQGKLSNTKILQTPSPLCNMLRRQVGEKETLKELSVLHRKSTR